MIVLGFSSLLCGSLAGCEGGGGTDAGLDVGALDSGSDAPLPLDAPIADAPIADVADAWVDAPSDAPLDAARDSGVPDAGNACIAAGGACVALVPDLCPDGIVGDPSRYGCGPGLGVACCLPLDTPPTCDFVGTTDEGWYRPDGRLTCNTTCAGAVATCENLGTRSEGWYADSTAAGCMSPPVDRLIEWLDCSP
jgi:hypothetical protein